MATSPVAERAADKVINSVKHVQDISVNALGTVTGLVGGFLPDFPALPMASKLPQPEAVVKKTFSFVEDVVKTNKQYALSVVQALQPLTGKIVPPARKTARKATEKA